jgi:hypothetical protein
MKKLLSIIATSLIIFVSVVALSSHKTQAEPPYFQTAVNTPTTTVSYLTTGTTTYTYDSSNNGGSAFGADSAILTLQVIATTTAYRLSIVPYVSDDGVDWYSIANSISTNATSTATTGNYSEYVWTFATSTNGVGGASASAGNKATVAYAATTTRLYQSLILPTPMRYLRVAVYNPGITNQSVAIWGNIYAKKQQAAR